MIEYHEREELAPRDVVSRAIVNEMARTGSTCVFLDVTHRPSDFLQREFPTIFHTCLAHGIEIWRDAIPVQAAAHFLMGGIWTDLETRTTVPGLFACGEAACTMVHGANRLASNSLLEGLVFGHRAGVAAAAYAEGVPRAVLKDLRIAAQTPTETSPTDVASLRGLITRTMWEAVGIRRRGELLDEALQNFAAMPEFIPPTREGIEYGNMRLIAYVVAMAALERTESRGAHFREDHPETDDLRWRRRLFLYRASSGHVATADTPTT
jgi:L-aspartate oxidase